LSEQVKEACLQRRTHVHEIKDLPREQVKPYVIYEGCILDTPKAECDKVRRALVAGETTQCGGLTSAILRDFCVALTSGDASKCKKIAEKRQREFCEALVTDDPSRCPKDSVDCRNMAALVASAKKDGLRNADKVDPWAAAAVKGSAACAPLLADLERICLKGE
jgi:hypothetical protein